MLQYEWHVPVFINTGTCHLHNLCLIQLRGYLLLTQIQSKIQFLKDLETV